MLLKGKIAVVTGVASPRGIGRATARLFAAEGARVAVLDIDGEGCAALAAELGEEHRAYACDVADRTRSGAVIDAVAADFDGVDLLVNCAGVVHGTPIEAISEDEYRAVVDINIGGNFNMARAVVPHMRRRGAGSIVCISSIAGQRGGGVFGSTHYSAAKAGILGLARALARELAPDGIRANAVAPGAIDNDFTKGRMTEAIKAEIANGVPLRRLGTPEDVAGACLFLASDLSAYVTGAVIDVNGGLHIH